MNRNRKIIIGLVSLIGVLAYNWTHTGGLLASYVRPAFVGYIAATGIELAVVGLSLRIADLRRNASGARFQVATLAAVVVVSALANIAEGYAVKFGESLTSANIGRLDIVQAIVSLSATGLLSLVTFAIAEIVGGDIEQQPAQPLATDFQPAQPTETDAASTPNDTAAEDRPLESPQMPTGSDLSVSVTENAHGIEQQENAKKRDFNPSENDDVLSKVSLTGETAIDIVNCLLAEPTASSQQIADRLGCSRQNVSRYLLEWEKSKKIARNGRVTFLEQVK